MKGSTPTLSTMAQLRTGVICSSAALLLALMLAAWAPACEGHGFLLEPLSRARALGYGEYASSAGNGLGRSPYRKNPDGSLLNDQADVCGDPHQDEGDMNLRGRPTNIQATYSAGSTISVKYRARVNHGGYLRVNICPSTRNNPSQACFDAYPLTNADTKYQRWWLQTGAYLVQTDYVTRWKLPQGVSCDGGCMLQVTYRTANSCVDSCSPAECGPVYAARRNPVTGQGPLDACGRTEIFRDCADIRITGSGGSSSGGSGSGGSSSGGSSSGGSSSGGSSSGGSTACGVSASTFCAGKAVGFYGDKCTNCAKYYWCYGSGATYMSCGAGTAMDSRGRQSGCNYPQNIVC